MGVLEEVVSAFGLEGSEDASPGTGEEVLLEPWVACCTRWTSDVAFAFCTTFLGNSSAPRSALEKCAFRANGLAAHGHGWPAVVMWLIDRVPVPSSAITMTSLG